MLKHYCFFLFALVVSATASLSAQITLTADNYGVQDSVILRDTLYYEGAFVPEIPMGGENQVWDYSNVQIDSLTIFLYDAVPEEDTCFATAQTVNYGTSSFQAFTYPSARYTAYEEGGRFDVGVKTDGAKFPLTAITGNPLDTLAVLPRTTSFRSTLISLPSTFGTITRDTFDQSAPLEITVAAFGLNRTPATQDLNTVRTVEVIGYGDLILPARAGFSSGPLEALLVKTTTVAVNTYTLAGGPAPPALLQAFGVSQNESVVVENYFFQVKGMGRSAANIQQRTPGSGDYQFRYRRVPPGITTGLGSINKPEPLSFFPNPVRPGGVLRLTAPADVTGGVVRLIDLQGRTITESTFSTLAGDTIEFGVPVSVKPGLYFQQVVNARGRLVGVGKVLVQ
jgi:hypothetical protein